MINHELEKAKLTLQTQLSNLRQKNCKNADIEGKVVEEKLKGKNKDKVIYLTRFTDNKGCDNDRRHGSAYCQECSDKHSK